jgi:hypothetical protein
MNMFKKTFTTVAMAAALGVSQVQAATMEDVERSFYPYKDGGPTFEGLAPGMTINEILDAAMFQKISDGWLEMTVGETTSFDLHPNYVQATRDNLGQVSLGNELGQINGFVAGRPFPEEPDENDPRAGEKLSWNYKYGYNWGDNAAIAPFYWKFRDMESGKIERTIKFNFHFLNFKHRVNQDPVPEFADNPSNLFRGIYVQVIEPFDVKNTQLLIHRSDDDLVRDNTWLYLGFQRRVRRLSSGQITDSFLGSDLMIEDFEGYNGRISDMNWTYKGTVNVMLPFYNHNALTLATDMVEKDGYQFVDFSGKGGCFPNITWQLRRAHILESDPTDDNHPISKRVHYIDAQTFTIPRTLIYDRKGDLWKSFIIGQAHPDHHLEKNKGTGVSIDDSFSQVDMQAGHCTTGQFKGQLDPAMNPPKLFTVQNMRAKGR